MALFTELNAKQMAMKSRQQAPKAKRLGKRAINQMMRAELEALPEGHPRRATILAELAKESRVRSRQRERKSTATTKPAASEHDREGFRGQGHEFDRNDQFGVDVALMHLSTATRHSTVEPTDEHYAAASRVLKIDCPVRNFDRKRADQLFDNYVPIEETLKAIESRGTADEYTPRTMRDLQCA